VKSKTGCRYRIYMQEK